MKKITFLLAFLSITALFTNLEHKDSLIQFKAVETENIDVPYLLSDVDLKEYYSQKIKEEHHLKELYNLTK